MPKFIVRLTRIRIIEETAELELSAKTPDDAEEAALAKAAKTQLDWELESDCVDDTFAEAEEQD